MTDFAVQNPDQINTHAMYTVSQKTFPTFSILN